MLVYKWFGLVMIHVIIISCNSVRKSNALAQRNVVDSSQTIGAIASYLLNSYRSDDSSVCHIESGFYYDGNNPYEAVISFLMVEDSALAKELNLDFQLERDYKFGVHYDWPFEMPIKGITRSQHFEKALEDNNARLIVLGYPHFLSNRRCLVNIAFLTGVHGYSYVFCFDLRVKEPKVLWNIETGAY